MILFTSLDIQLIIKKAKLFTLLFLFFAAIVSCSRNKSDKDIKIVAKIADRVITVDEFLERAELTPRLPYCSSNTPRDKAIVLNTLIAEKLLALEVQDEPALVENEKFQLYLKGRKEQYMRGLFFYEKAYNKVKLDTADIVNAYEFAGREYTLEFYSLDSLQAKKLQNRFKNQPNAKGDIFDGISLTEKTPVKKVTWKAPETSDIVLQALFSRPYNAGDLLGPIHINYNEYVVMKIVDWKDSKALGGTKALTRWKDVERKLIKMKANQIWSDYIRNLMKGKKIEFNKTAYLKVFKLFESWLAKRAQQKKDIKISSNEMGDENFSLALSDEQFLQTPFCKVDESVWTVGDIKKAIMSHPLVFRKREMRNRDELFEQFKLAIADLIRDHYITQDAYKRGYDKRESVRRYVQKWHDAYAAIYHRDKFLKKMSQKKDFDPARLKGSNTYFDVYLDSLKTVYDDVITINLSQFEEIKLTSVPMFAVNTNQPYMLPTPAFPLLTDNDKLNYRYLIH